MRTGKRRILRASNTTREVMIRDIPEVFEGAVEADETYIGGQWRNKRKAEKAQETKRGRGTRSNPYSVYFVVMDMYGLNLFPM
jgi:hypothetical protein